MSKIQQRIGYAGPIEPLLQQVCTDYHLGEFHLFTVESMGYEDFNLRVETARGQYFFKIFSKFRNLEECVRYVNIIIRTQQEGVSQPEIYKDTKGYLYETAKFGLPLRLCVMEYIKGQNLVSLKHPLKTWEVDFLVQQAAMINKIPIKPEPIYDSWAIGNFLQESKKKLPFVSKEDSLLIFPLIAAFKNMSIQSLPHCFVHGDLSKANIIKGINNRLYIVDFGVANYYPRIQELAMLFCETFFDTNNLDLFDRLYTHVIEEYQKYIPLEKRELQYLPLFIKLGHAMHVLTTAYEEKVNHNDTFENKYLLQLGRAGLSFTSNHFQ